MDTLTQYTLLRHIMWDYNIPPEELFEVLHGRREFAGHYNREKLVVKLLESYSWFTILQLLPAMEFKELLTNNVINKLRLKSLRTKYQYARKRLQELVPVKTEPANAISLITGRIPELNSIIIDSVSNILANKLTAIVSRDERRDIFDIIYISINYSFNWQSAFLHAKEEVLINELDVARRLDEYPVELFKNIDWESVPPKNLNYEDLLKIISNDFILGLNNSLGKGKTSIENASLLKPHELIN